VGDLIREGRIQVGDCDRRHKKCALLIENKNVLTRVWFRGEVDRGKNDIVFCWIDGTPERRQGSGWE